MNIQVVRKKEVVQDVVNISVTLLFKKTHIRTQHGGKIPIVTIYDEKGEYLPASVKLTHIQTNVPSTLLSRWINTNCADKLLTLVDKCYTVEKVRDGVRGRWYFTNKDEAVYGLHKVKLKEDGKTFRICRIDDSIGMQAVGNILKLLDIDFEFDYDVKTDKMKSINLLGV